MAFLIGGANSDSGAYQIDNSLRFHDSDNAYLSITPSSAGNRRTFTYSGWIKTDVATASSKALLSCGSDSGSNDYIMFQSGDKLRFSFGTEGEGDVITNRLFRDPAAWYHIVFAVDTTQGTAANRVKLYVNGTQETDLATTYPDQNYDTSFNNTEVQRIGARAYSATQYYEGYMSDVYLIDGQQLDASSFGETDDNGVWIPKKYTGTYGTNGFKLEFKQTGTSANASGMGADTSGNGNHLTPTNLAAIDVTTDTPTNNFATMNPLDNYYSSFTFSEGNCKFVTHGSNISYNTATIGDLKKGKWYLEVKYTDPSHTGDGDAAGEFYGEIAVIGQKMADTSTDLYPSSQQHNFAYSANNGRIKSNNTAGTVHGDSISADGQIIGFLIDLDNDRVTTHLNGQYADGSGNHDESSPTAYVSITDPASTPLGGYMIGFGESVSSSESGNQNTGTYEINFGNPSFSISSGNADANGYGNFEYAVPSGYYALCTKNLAEFG